MSIFTVCLILLLLLFFHCFYNFLAKTQNLLRVSVVVHTSSPPWKSSAIMKGKATDSLKPPLTKRPSDVVYWELNEMSGSGGYLRQENLQAT